MPRSIIVIGAGIGGLAAAVRLAQAGYDITVVESSPQVGGTAQDYQARGFSWSLAPPLFAARPQLDALFRDLGRSPADYLRWLPIDPQTRFFFPDGAVFNMQREWTRTAAEIAQIEPGDVAGFLRFLAYAAGIHDRRQYGFGSLLRSWLRAGPFRSAFGAARRFVRSEKLARVLAHYASHSGGSPYAVPAPFSELAHTFLNDGLWYPRGGAVAIAQALAALADDYDVAIRLACPIEHIVIERNRVSGVKLAAAGGEILRADAVVANMDPISAARYLLPAGSVSAPALRRLVQTPMSSSVFIMLLGIRGTFPGLAPYNVFFSEDGRAESDQIFQRAVMPADPTITLFISSKIDRQCAPYNQENWLIAVNAPALSDSINWATEGAFARDRILNILEARYGLDLRDRIRVEKQLTPADLAQMSGAWRGALHGELPHGRRAALARPQIRSPHAKGLYHVGGGVLPGGGTAQAILSAEAAVTMIRRDLK
ncbi:MAG: phytoene desaturase family protein [Chloroflexota bacterium]|nr:phytoene desaturase family protein [Chloroflexota bacterium]MDE2909068.1 phytoene desaturase family protein [Chloroflexota bacterium]